MARPAKIHIVGHSFIRRLEEYSRQQDGNRMNLDGGDHLVTFSSFPGGKITDLPRDYAFIQSRNPDVVLIHLGTNDLADPSASPAALAQSLYDMARYLAQIVGVREVLLMQCFYRTTSGRYSAPDPQYNACLLYTSPSPRD